MSRRYLAALLLVWLAGCDEPAQRGAPGEPPGSPPAGELGALADGVGADTGVGSPAATASRYRLPDERRVPWAGNVGVKDDIPSRLARCATLKPSGGDDTARIQAAIAACPAEQAVMLEAGTFKVSAPITVRSGVTLRGAGMGRTIIKGLPGMIGAYVVGVRGTASLGASIAIVAGLQKGSTTITTGAPHGWAANDLLLVDQVNAPLGDPVVTSVGYDGTCSWCGRASPSGFRSLGQVAMVTSVASSTSAVLEIPLYWSYEPTRSPQATRYLGVTSRAGMEDFSVDNTASGNASQSDDGATLMVRGAANCWALRVEAIGSYRSMIKVHDAYRCTIRGGQLHDGVPPTPVSGAQYGLGRAYGVFMNPAASANLIENNQLYHLVDSFMMSGAVSGNVLAYNSVSEPYSSNTSWMMTAFDFHGGHSIMNLFEGNITESRLVTADNVWGSSSHNTFFRNRHTLSPGKAGATWNVDLNKNATYYSLVGNVLGSPGVEDVYEQQNVVLTALKAIYRLGYTSDGDGDPAGNDPRVYATVLRHGNWDSVNGRAIWNGNDERALPPSMYLTSKPAWWGSSAWPAIGPDLSPMYPAARAPGEGTPWGP